MSYDPGIQDKSVTDVAEPSNTAFYFARMPKTSEIAIYFADTSQNNIQPSDTSSRRALEGRIEELSRELESSQNTMEEWKARALSHHAMKVDWDLAYDALHQSMRKDLVEIEGDIGHLENSISHLNEYEQRTHGGVQVEVAKVMTLINSDLTKTEEVNEPSTETAACIKTRLAIYTGEHEEFISQAIERRHTEIIRECKAGLKMMVDHAIGLELET
ncbi:hypothetical protein BKA64DRAFT_699034 [Cadophora sp. MPI-SDFR-AT-0126]|nr:hypothetical protein BKA64DRAFT_699034 [Leotiomycetes sp. MPI-SDFR-AT-0126]